MAKENGKHPKVEEPNSTEVINSLNKADAEKKLVNEAKQQDDDDSEPIPLLTEEGSAELFPGVPYTTVTKQCKKGNSDLAPLYLN